MIEQEPLYVISVAARLLGLHAQTLRKYEREHFVVPSRSKGRLRLYSAADLEQLRQVKFLVDDRGLNLAGVELALAVTRQLRHLREVCRATRTTEEVRQSIEEETRTLFDLLGAHVPAESLAWRHAPSAASRAPVGTAKRAARRRQNAAARRAGSTGQTT